MATSSILEDITIDNIDFLNEYLLSMENPAENSDNNDQTDVYADDISDGINMMKEGIRIWSKR